MALDRSVQSQSESVAVQSYLEPATLRTVEISESFNIATTLSYQPADSCVDIDADPDLLKSFKLDDDVVVPAIEDLPEDANGGSVDLNDMDEIKIRSDTTVASLMQNCGPEFNTNPMLDSDDSSLLDKEPPIIDDFTLSELGVTLILFHVCVMSAKIYLSLLKILQRSCLVFLSF